MRLKLRAVGRSLRCAGAASVVAVAVSACDATVSIDYPVLGSELPAAVVTEREPEPPCSSSQSPPLLGADGKSGRVQGPLARKPRSAKVHRR